MPYKNIIKKEQIAVLKDDLFIQGPQYFSSACGLEEMMPKNIMEGDESDCEQGLPYLSITEQPTDIFRYRYGSEKGSHGGIKGENFSRRNKCYPTVKLENAPFCKRIKIKVSLYTNANYPEPHVYELTGKNCWNGECLVDLNEESTATFPSLAIQTRKREEVVRLLLERKIKKNGFKSLTKEIKASLEKEALDEVKKINLDSAKLCFEAFFEDDLKRPICDKVFSNPINNQKAAACGDLKITRLSRVTGTCSGGDEVFLFCEKVKKEDIKVRFYEKDGAGNISWEGFGIFSPADVHHQVAIPFKTPKYKPISAETVVFIELYRPSDRKYSESIKFTYVPNDEVCENSRKRKRVDLDASISSFEFPCPRCSYNLFDDILLSSTENDTITDEIITYINEDPDDLFDENLFDTVEPFETNPIMEVSQCISDCASSVLDNMGSLSLEEERNNKVKHSCLSKSEKIGHKLKDYADGINKILKNRDDSTYLFYGPRLFLIQDENGNSMLHLAILEQFDNLNLIQIMLNMTSEEMINKSNKLKETPLHLAIKGNHPKIVFLLLIKGGNPNILDMDGNNCLHLAAKKNNVQCMKMLLPQNENLGKYKAQIDSLNHDGMSPFHIAIVNNYEDCTNYLFDAGADINLCELKCGKSPLHLAIDNPNLMRKLLKQPGINVQAKDYRGYSAFYLACIQNGILYEKGTENDVHKIIEFLENLHVKKTSELEFYESESTDSSDYEDAAEQVLHPERNFGVHDYSPPVTNTMNCTSTFNNDECINGNESSFVNLEKELCKYLDSDDNWKKLAAIFEIDIESVAVLDKNSSPGKTVLKIIKREYHPLDMNKMKDILEMVGLEKGVQILQKTCAF